MAEEHPKVRCYAKNSPALGFEVPCLFNAAALHYQPDFLLHVDDGHGEDDLLNLIVEIKGYRRKDAGVKRETIETRWIPAVTEAAAHARGSQ